MPQGGARNRAGRPPDPNSLRSAKRPAPTLLPAAGYDGEAPDFPLTRPTQRERVVWRWAWTTPQAAAWIREPWRWHTVATWVRYSVRAENRNAAATLITATVRLADQIGLTPAGLRENGWAVAKDQLEERRETPAEPPAPAPMSARERLKAAAGGGA